MINIIKSNQRGRTKIDWLNSFHSFSFSEYFDRQRMQFGPLRVLNEDFVDPASGFPTHPHKNMEIITYVLRGALEHRDSTGTHSVISAGDLQKMTAGKGVYHSEFNPSKVEDVHLFQIWIMPDMLDLTPSYEQITLIKDERKNKLQLVASNKKSEGRIFISQDVNLYLADLEKETEIKYQIQNGRGVFLQTISGELSVGEFQLSQGDAIEISSETEVIFSAKSDTELMLFDVKI
ncbi:MAG: pirin family protein [Ignavibacteriaceae bacterium]|nr:pirin family protein [Ignavibacteriaceae bacterium]